MIVQVFIAGSDKESLRGLHWELREQGVAPELTVEQLQELFGSMGWLAFQDGRCVAGAAMVFADAAREADLVWLALPGASNEVREALLEVVLVRARDLGVSSLLCYLVASDRVNIAFMDSGICKAESVAGYSRWVTELGPLKEITPPGEAVVCATDDLDALLVATRVVWDDLPGHKPATRAAVKDAVKAFGAANQFLLLGGSGSPVGLVRGVMISVDEAYVDAPGLAPDWRIPENYAYLLAHVMSHLASLGARTAVMESWGDPPAALEGFRSAGWVQQVSMPGRRISVTATAG